MPTGPHECLAIEAFVSILDFDANVLVHVRIKIENYILCF